MIITPHKKSASRPIVQVLFKTLVVFALTTAPSHGFNYEKNPVLKEINSRAEVLFDKESGLEKSIKELTKTLETSLSDETARQLFALDLEREALAPLIYETCKEYADTYEALRKSHVKLSDEDKFCMENENKRLFYIFMTQGLDLETRARLYDKLGLQRRAIQVRKRRLELDTTGRDSDMPINTKRWGKLPENSGQFLSAPLKGFVVWELAMSYFWVGEYEKAQKYFDESLLLSEGRQKCVDIGNGTVRSLGLDLLEAQGHTKEAIDSAKSTPWPNQYARLSRLYAKIGNVVESDRNYKLAIEDKFTSEVEKAELEIAHANYSSAIERLNKSLPTWLNSDRREASRILLLKSLAESKSGKINVAKDDLNMCRGWLDELPALKDLTERAVTSISDITHENFPLNNPVREKFAIVFGVGQFRDQSIPSLKYSVKDAQDVRDMLIDTYGFKPQNIRLLTNEAATKKALIDTLDGWINGKAESDDLVFCFLATHGTPANRDAAAQNYIVAYDTQKERLFGTGVPMDLICKLLRDKCKARRTLVVSDTCYSGAMTKIFSSVNESKNDGNLDPEKYLVSQSMLVVASSDKNQRSWESRRYQNGVFTRQLIECFKRDRDYSSFSNLFKDIEANTEKEVKLDFNADQTPRIAGTWAAQELK